MKMRNVKVISLILAVIISAGLLSACGTSGEMKSEC